MGGTIPTQGDYPMKAYLPTIFGTIFIASLAANAGQYFSQKRTEFLLQIETKRNEINGDQINEMVANRNGSSAFGNPSIDAQFAENQGYIRGIQSVVSKVSPQESEISSIWHAGYYRGMEQTDFVSEMQYEKGYSSGFQAGQRENMKAINTIISSGENVQNALKKFADDLQQKNEGNSESKPKTTEKKSEKLEK